MLRPTRIKRTLFVATMLLFGLAVLPAFADTVHKRDGRTVEGEIIEENDTQVVVQTKFGPVTVPRSEVLKIEKGKTLVQQFKERWDTVDQDDAMELLDLADWAHDNRLRREAKKVYRRVLRVDPENEAAHRALGDEFVDGKWKTKKELDEEERRRKADERKAKAKSRREKSSSGKSSGSSSGGRDPMDGIGDTAGPAAEFVKVIKENAEGDKKTAAELEDFFGQRFSVATSEHFSLRAQMPPPEVHELVTLAERLYVTTNLMFGLEPDRRFWKNQYLFFHVKQKGSFDDLIEWIDSNIKELDPETKRFYKDGGGMISSLPSPISADLERSSPLSHGIAHSVGQTWIVWFTRGRAPAWLSEGFAAFTSVNEFGVNTTYCQTNTKYANRVEIADKNSDTAFMLVCHDIIDGKVGDDGYKHPWNEMVKRSLNQLDFADLAKSWSVVEFLMRHHRENFKKYLLTLHQYENEEDCLRESFGWTGEQLDQEWEAYVRANYDTSAAVAGKR